MSGEENSFVGSLINGLGTNVLAGNDVGKGLMINAALLAGSGGLSGLGSAATQVAGTTSALTGPAASTAANTSFMAPAGVNAGAVMGASQAAPPLATTTPGIFATPAKVSTFQPLSSTAGQTAALERPLSLNMSGVEPGQGYEYTFGDRLSQAGQFAQQNPVLTQMAMQSAQQMLQQPQRQAQPPGLLRGNQMQVAAPQYQVGVPQVSLI